jgi:selenophosphate synthetase-related protein
MFNIVDYAIKTKRFVGGLGRLKKDGTIVKINVQIFSRKTAKNGDEFIIINNFLGKMRTNKKKWQMVLMKNLVALNENKWSHIKKVA